jgi:hypothetical protein
VRLIAGDGSRARCGRSLIELYTEFFHIPTFDYHLPGWP